MKNFQLQNQHFLILDNYGNKKNNSKKDNTKRNEHL